MDIDRCNSIFELFAAFNFTYAILSDISEDNGEATRNSYVDIIDNRLLKSFSKFFRKGNTLLHKINTKIETVRTILNISPDIVELKDAHTRYDQLKDLCEVWLKEVETQKEIERKRINAIFPFLSFFLATFCISVLGVAISESPFKHFSLFMLVFCSLFVYAFIFYKKENNNYVTLAKIILWGIFSICILHFIIKFSLPYFNDGFKSFLFFFDTNIYAKIILIFTALTLPFSHFIYYFFSISKINNTIEMERFRTVETYENQYADISQKIEQFL